MSLSEFSNKVYSVPFSFKYLYLTSHEIDSTDLDDFMASPKTWIPNSTNNLCKGFCKIINSLSFKVHMF